MKIISWNCNGKFREKLKIISALDADIHIIQECENPAETKDKDYSLWANNYIWMGRNKNKGLGVFGKNSINLEKLNWNEICLKYFLPIKVNNQFQLLAVWTQNPYIEEYYIYHQLNKQNYDDDTIVFGDFNSNKNFDHKYTTRKERGHMSTVNEFKLIGLEDAYHYVSKEEQGSESKNTFYLYRKKERGYHIDHCFVNPKNLISYSVLDDSYWLEFSDHMPCVLEIK